MAESARDAADRRALRSRMRRRLVAAGAGAMLAVAVRPASAAAEDLATAIRNWTGGASVTPGRVTLDIARLVDNGNSVPVEVTVDSPMTVQQHVVGIALFNEKNPQNDIAQFTLSPLAGRARVATRIRLATTQQLVAVAKMNDGSCWTHTVEVLVTVASCIEE